MNWAMAENDRVAHLQAEVERLQRELDQSSSEKIQSVSWTVDIFLLFIPAKKRLF